jgi:ABC-type nitrate/sulfonate/bicarbonate transport system substrate-binding protein
MRTGARCRVLAVGLAALGILSLGQGGAAAERATSSTVHTMAVLPQGSRVTITTPSSGLHEMPLVVALRRGLFTEEGVDATRIQMAPPVSVAAVLSGEADYTISTQSTTGAIIGADAPMKLVMGMAVRALHVLMTNDPTIQRVTDLRGRGVATNTLTDTSAAMVRFALRAQGLEAQTDVALQPLGQSPNRLAALQTGQVSAVILDLAQAQDAEQYGARVLLRPSDLPDITTSGLGITESKLRDRPQEIEAVIRAHLRAIRHMRENREDTIAALMDHLEQARDAATTTYDLGIGAFAPDGIISDAGLQLLIEAASLSSDRPARLTPAQLADFTIVRRVSAQLGGS